MNKKQLIEALKDYKDTAPIVVDVGWEVAAMDKLGGKPTLRFAPAASQTAVVFGVSSNPVSIILEL